MKHEIEIEGLPGWMIAHSVKVIELDSGDSEQCTYNAQVIAKRVKPRRIVLEETENDSDGIQQVFYIGSTSFSTHSRRVWKQAKETDLSLHNADDKESLRLSVDDARDLLHYIPSGTEFCKRLLEFTSDKK